LIDCLTGLYVVSGGREQYVEFVDEFIVVQLVDGVGCLLTAGADASTQHEHDHRQLRPHCQP